MKPSTPRRRRAASALVATLLSSACTVELPSAGVDDEPADQDPWEQRLGERVVDYGAALRVAALRLTGELPTLAEITGVVEAADVAAAYRAQIDAYLADVRFAGQMLEFWRDVLKMGGAPADPFDSAPTFAAQVTVEGRSYAELFTAPSGTCPTFDRTTGTFTAIDCDNGAPPSGLLSHPGVHAHFSSNLAFRRVRWVQETFACTAFPAEVGEPRDVGGASPYTSPWPFESIAGAATGAAVDFLDVSSVTCANCHSTMNHLAPLFANFDAQGIYLPQIAVPRPTVGNPPALRTDWLPDGEPTAWRVGVEAADLPALGAAMAADPQVAECAVARVWNWALGRTDIVDTLAVVPVEVIARQLADFEAGGLDLRRVIRGVFTSDDFIRF
jgi:hypothetical protein